MRLISRRSMMAGVAAGSALTLLVRASAQTPSGPFKLEPLSYPSNKNEPHIDAQTMEIHHGRHHAAFVNNLNTAVAQYPELGSRPLHEVLSKLTDVPETVRTTVRNSGGGHANHTMFWQTMGGAGGEPAGDLRSAIVRDFGALTGELSSGPHRQAR